MSAAEQPRLKIEVDALTAPDSIAGPEERDPKRYGVIVESGRRCGLLLPDWESVNTVAYQIEIAKRKASLGPQRPVSVFRLEARRFR